MQARRSSSVIPILALAACGMAGVGVVQTTHDVSFAESVIVPIKIVRASDGSESSSGAVVTVKIVNTSSNAVTITELVPEADAGLQASYLGYTMCRTPCVGAGDWSEEDQRNVKRSTDGTLPIVLRPDGPGTRSLRLIFRLEVVTPSGFATLRSACRLRLRTVRATLASGRVLRAGGGGLPIAGVDLPTPTTNCPSVGDPA